MEMSLRVLREDAMGNVREKVTYMKMIHKMKMNHKRKEAGEESNESLAALPSEESKIEDCGDAKTEECGDLKVEDTGLKIDYNNPKLEKIRSVALKQVDMILKRDIKCLMRNMTRSWREATLLNHAAEATAAALAEAQARTPHTPDRDVALSSGAINVGDPLELAYLQYATAYIQHQPTPGMASGSDVGEAASEYAATHLEESPSLSAPQEEQTSNPNPNPNPNPAS